MRKALLIAAAGIWVVMGVSTPGSSHAAIPQMMHYQGKLTDSGGRLVADGTYPMIFSICADATGGTGLWSETWDGSNAVRVTGGLFDVPLGSRNPMSLPFDVPYWLELQVLYGASYETLLPRQQIVSSAYAFRADNANKAEAVADGAVTTDSLSEGAVTVEKISPDAVAFIHPVPGVSGISPDNKAAGYSTFTATITGENFQSASRARIGSTTLTGEAVGGSTSMTAIVPAGIPAGIHDVSVSSIYFDWGTGSGLFRVNTPTPTTTPTSLPTQTPTPTPTQTPTPTPWGSTTCAAKGGWWAAKNDGSGENGCWFATATGQVCNARCGEVGLACANSSWNDTTSCSVCTHFFPSRSWCQSNGNISGDPYHEEEGNYYCTYQAVPVPAATACPGGTSYGEKLCVCGP